MNRTRFAGLSSLSLVFFLAACGQPAAQPAGVTENQPWSYTAPPGSPTALSLDAGSNTLTYEPLLFAANGYGPFETNMSNGGNQANDGKALTLNGVVYQKGLGVHANSELRYSLLNTRGAVCATFTASVGVDDEVGSLGSVRFKVFVDNILKFNSGVLTGNSATQSLAVDIQGGGTLRLVVDGGPDGISSDHADWVNPTIHCSGGTLPAPGSVDRGFVQNGFTTTKSKTVTTTTGRIVGFGEGGQSLDQDGHLELAYIGNDSFTVHEVIKVVAGSSGDIFVFGKADLQTFYPPIPNLGQNGLLFVSHYLANGQRDPQFGNAREIEYKGIHILEGTSFFEDPNGSPASGGVLSGGPNVSFAVRPDGKIIVGGTIVLGNVSRFIKTPYFIRLLSNGTIDGSFGVNGLVFGPPNGETVVQSIEIQRDNKMVVGGVHYVGTSTELAVFRYLENGSGDPSFGANGFTKIRDATIGSVSTVNIFKDGRILVAGSSEKFTDPGLSCYLSRLLPNGTVDGTFNFSTLVGYGSATYRQDQDASLAVQADGRVILGGCEAIRVAPLSPSSTDLTYEGFGPALFRFNTDGSQDKTFGIPLYQDETTQVIGAPVIDSQSVLIQPPSVGGKIISGLQVLTRLWP